MSLKILDECCLMIPPVEFFQDEDANEGLHPVAGWAHIAVVTSKLKYANGSEQTNVSTDSWRSCLNQVCETVRMSASNPSSELRSYNGVDR